MMVCDAASTVNDPIVDMLDDATRACLDDEFAIDRWMNEGGALYDSRFRRWPELVTTLAAVACTEVLALCQIGVSQLWPVAGQFRHKRRQRIGDNFGGGYPQRTANSVKLRSTRLRATHTSDSPFLN
jgi:hypothetical protein